MSVLDRLKVSREPDVEEMALLNHAVSHKLSYLAIRTLGEEHPLRILRSEAGYYLGAMGSLEGMPGVLEGTPLVRDSEYFDTFNAARQAFLGGSWQQRLDV